MLVDARIANAVSCVPPANKPTPEEIRTCNQFLAATIAGMPQLAAIVALGRIAHDAVLLALDGKRAKMPFAHGAVHELGRLTLFDSFHCSPLNTHTGRLTPKMFAAVFAKARARLAK